MERVLTAEEMRACDAFAIDDLGIPGVVLMENAGKAASLEALRLLRGGGGGRAVVYCGSGNNGGDGFVVARRLHAAGVPVLLILSKEVSALSGDAAVNARIAERLGLPMLVAGGGEEKVDGWVALRQGEGDPSGADGDPRELLGAGDLVVDALLGTGLERDVTGPVSDLIDEISMLRARGCSVLALDVPSGISSDTGRVMGRGVEADATVTFGYLKRGLLTYPGAALAGEVVVADIGLPNEVESVLEGAPVYRLDERSVRGMLPAPALDAHKGTFGHVLVVAGSADRPGAAALVCEGALRSGAGLVTLAARPGGDASLRTRLPEAMGLRLEGEGPLAPSDLPALLFAAEGKDVIAIGPGIPRGPETGALLEALARRAKLPMVVDADALNAVAGSLSGLAAAEVPLVLTPHPMEMARLVGEDVAFVQADRLGVSCRLAGEVGAHVVLKGAGTVIADPDGAAAVCTRGGPSLATGGTGDVLTGVLAALIASGMPAGFACRAGVLAHAVAGEMAGERLGRAGSLAGDLALDLAAVWREWGY